MFLGAFIDIGLKKIHYKNGQHVSKQFVKSLKGMMSNDCLLGGMMADGGNEHFFFTRKIERELQVVGLVNLNCRMLLANLDYMFGEKKGVLLMPLYAALPMLCLEC